MTVLACLHELGLAFSDVMLSEDSPGGHILLPTTGSTRNIPHDLAFSPTRLVRKFFRISERGRTGMFLIAGTVSHIEHLISNIKIIRSDMRSLADKYRRILNVSDPVNIIHTACLKTEDEGFKEFEILGVVQGKLFVRNFDANRVAGRLPYYGELYVAGSGGPDLYRWLSERASQYAQRPLADDPVALKTARSMNSIPMMLLEEDSSSRADTVTKGVGGYYEAYLLAETGLQPIDAVLTVTASFQGKGRGAYLDLDRLYFHKYVGDWLIVLSLFDLPLQIYRDRPLKVPLKNFVVFKIPPIFDQGKEPNWRTAKLAAAIESAEHFRLTLRRHTDPGPVHMRFSEGEKPCRRLFSSKVVGDNLVISLDETGFNYYAVRFPKLLPAHNQPLQLLS